MTSERARQLVEKHFGLYVAPELWNELLHPFIIPTYSSHNEKMVLTEDVLSLMAVLHHLIADNHSDDLFAGVQRRRLTSPRLQIDIGSDASQLPPAFYAACNNLLRVESSAAGCERHQAVVNNSYIGLSRITASDPAILARIDEQLARFKAVHTSAASQFANSAYYMGSKKVLAPFIVEAVSAITSPESSVLDLMCGSGASAGAFSRIWPTYASDAQAFCRNLALVQGGGYCRGRAQEALKTIEQHAQENVELLQRKLGDFVQEEEQLFHEEFDSTTVERYRHFCEKLPLYPSDSNLKAWGPNAEVQKRKLNPKLMPYCLCTAYFANVYFGLRQSIEIDSIRFAIDQLDNELDQRWATGALLTTLSAVALTYAGHFAQPVIRSVDDISISNVGRILETRAISVLHEFGVRLTCLSEESERARHPVRIVDGPWKRALNALRTMQNGDLTVYVDAPYKREEYSRYYHVLETLALYKYPASIGVARMPEKSSGERFRSEFFTRSKVGIVSALSEVITTVMKYSWRCAWSYSDSGAIDPLDVVDQVTTRVGSSVRSFATPYFHKPQGGKRRKRVTEYVLLFDPRNN